MNGLAPLSFSTWSTALTTSAKFEIPRLPTPTAILIPGVTFAKLPDSTILSNTVHRKSIAFDDGVGSFTSIIFGIQLVMAVILYVSDPTVSPRAARRSPAPQALLHWPRARWREDGRHIRSMY